MGAFCMLDLDFYSDGGRYLRETVPYDQLPSFVKEASFVGGERLSPEDYALVLQDEKGVHPLYPRNDIGNTALSTHYFLGKHAQLSEEAIKTAAMNLSVACQMFRLEIPDELLKLAGIPGEPDLIEDKVPYTKVRNLKVYGMVDKRRPFPKKPTKVKTYKKPDIGHSDSKLKEAAIPLPSPAAPMPSPAAPMPSPVTVAQNTPSPGPNFPTPKTAPKKPKVPGPGFPKKSPGPNFPVPKGNPSPGLPPPQKKVAGQMSRNGHALRGRIMAMKRKEGASTDPITTPRPTPGPNFPIPKVKPAKTKPRGPGFPNPNPKAPGPGFPGTNPKSPGPNFPLKKQAKSVYTTPMPKGKVEFKSTSGTSVRQAPDNKKKGLPAGKGFSGFKPTKMAMVKPYDETTKAAAYFNENWRGMNVPDRVALAQELVPQCAPIGVDLVKEAHIYAEGSYDLGKYRVALKMRQAIMPSANVYQELDKVASAAIRTEMAVSNLWEADVETGMSRYWDSKIQDPVLSCIKVKTAEEQRFIVGNDYTTESCLKQLGAERRDLLEQTFGDSFATQFQKSPVTVFKSLPDDTKQVLVRLSRDYSDSES